jgi:hypothetical protein
MTDWIKTPGRAGETGERRAVEQEAEEVEDDTAQSAVAGDEDNHCAMARS